MASGGNPFAYGGGSGATANGQDPVGVAQAGTQKLLGDVSNAKDPFAYQQAQDIAAGKTGHTGSWLSDVFNTLDLPRSAVVSGLDTLVHGGGFKGWLKGTEGHMTAGHLLNDLGVHNHLVDSIGGFVGDVALDPLTYVGGLGAIGKVGEVSGHVTDAVLKTAEASRMAAEAAKTGDAVSHAAAAAKGLEATTAAGKDALGAPILTGDTLSRLKTQGLAGLNDTERQFLQQAHPGIGNLHSGIGIKLPGAPRIPLAHTDAISAPLHGLVSRIADKQAVQKFTEKVVPMGALKNAQRSAALASDGQRVAALGGLERLLPEAGGVANTALRTFGPELIQGMKDVGKGNEHLLPAALEGDAAAQQAIRSGGGDFTGVQNTLAKMHQQASDLGVPIGKVEDYFPHQLTHDAQQLFATKGASAARTAFAGELERTYKPGSEFLGTKLETGSIGEMNQIAHEVYGKDAVDLFNSNPRDVLNNYAHGLTYRMGQQHLANKLDEAGITLSGDAAHTPEDWASLGTTGANAGRMAPSYVKDALGKIADEQAKSKAAGKGVLGYYDKALNTWKQYALAMPGKAVRHMFANTIWGHYLAGVDPRNTAEAFRTWRAFQKGGIDSIKNDGTRSELQAALDQGLNHGHDFHPQDLTGPKGAFQKANRVNPLSTKHGYFRANQDMQRNVQDYWRYAMFHDAMKKGAAAPEAAQKVRMFLGDPHNITSFERSTARRIVPFYTFLRQNMPTELKAMATEPQKFVNAFQAPKQEIEQNTKGQSLVPEYIKDSLGVRMPFQSGGNDVYLSPDLPFDRLGQLVSSKNQIASQTSPLIQDLIASVENTDTFTGQPFSPYAKAQPKAWGPLAQIMAALHIPGAVQHTKTTTDFGQTTPAGTWELTPKDETLIESLLPPLSQLRRALPSEPGMQSRHNTTILSDLLGQTFRTNDPSQQAGELYARQAGLKALIEQLQNEGKLPKYISGFRP